MSINDTVGGGTGGNNAKNSGKLDLKLIKIMAYPSLAFGVKRLVKTGLNRFCAVLQLSKFR